MVINQSISEDKHQAAVTKLRFTCESRKPACHAKFYSRSHDAVIRFYDAAGNVIETHLHKGEFKEWWSGLES